MTSTQPSGSITGDIPRTCPDCADRVPVGSTLCPSCGAAVGDLPDLTLPLLDRELDEAGARELEALLRAETDGEYEVLREIGRGGMGVVYLAREVTLGRDVAMKVLPPTLTYGRGAISRFRREARTAAALEHPNIIPIYRVASQTGKLFWYTMKYLEGRSLSEVLAERKGLPLSATITILERVADALDHAHQRHVIHRDVKPANVMLENRGHIVVTDFGIAKEAVVPEGTPPLSGSIIGTPFYMSPEQCRGDQITGASDQYAVAIMAYQMLSGRMPFDSPTVVGLLQKHVTETPPPLETVVPGLPPHVYVAVAKALAKDPGERFASVTGFVRALAGPTGETTVRLPRYWSLRQRVSHATAQVKEPHRRILATVVPALVGAGLLGALWWSSGDPAPVLPPPPTRAPRPPQAFTEAGIELGRLRLVGLPRGTRIWIDGRLRSGSELELGAGLHELRLEIPGMRATVDTLLVPAGGSATYQIATQLPVAVGSRPSQPPPGAPGDTAQAAAVASEPAAESALSGVLVVHIVDGGGARISVDGAFRQEGTAHREILAPGAHRLQLERDGYAPLDTAITVAARDSVIVRLTLQKVGS